MTILLRPEVVRGAVGRLRQNGEDDRLSLSGCAQATIYNQRTYSDQSAPSPAETSSAPSRLLLCNTVDSLVGFVFLSLTP